MPGLCAAAQNTPALFSAKPPYRKTGTGARAAAHSPTLNHEAKGRVARPGVCCLAGGATRKRTFRGFSMDGEKSACGPRQRAGKRDPTRLLMVTVSVPLTAPGVSGYASSQNFPREEKKRWENQVEAKAAGAGRVVVRAGTGPQPRAIRRAAGAATLLPKGPNAGGLVATSSPPDRRSTGGRA